MANVYVNTLGVPRKARNGRIYAGNSFTSINRTEIVPSTTPPADEYKYPYGGIVTWRTGLTFDISAAGRPINGILYEAAATEKTLSAAHATLNRIDVFYIDTTGTIGVLEGTPADNPLKPSVNPATQYELSFIEVPAAATEPADIDTEVIYNENTEWTASAVGVTADFNSTTAPKSGAKCAEFTNIESGDEIQFESVSLFSGPDYTAITLFLKMKSADNNGNFLEAYFTNNGNPRSKLVNIEFDRQSTAWQNITLAITDFEITNNDFDGLAFRWFNPGGGTYTGFYLDNIRLQKGIELPTFTDTYTTALFVDEATGELVLQQNNGQPEKRVVLPGGDSHPPVTIAEESADLASIGEDQVLTINPQTSDNIKVPVSDDYSPLYNFYAANDARNIAPVGWHIPTETEWETLKSYLGGASVAGGKLKEAGFSYWDSPNTGATNETGFTAIGAGMRSGAADANFFGLRWEVHYWSSYNDGINSQLYGVRNGDSVLESIKSTRPSEDEISLAMRKEGHAIRFIKDDSTDPGTMTDNDGNEYPTVKIGDQVWTAKDHRGYLFRNDDEITYVENAFAWSYDDAIPKYVYYIDNLQNVLDNIDHNSTKNKQGGNEENNEFYHLTAAELAKVQALDNSIEIYIDFLDTTAFVFTAPYAMKFTAQTSEGADATISPVLNTDLAQYDDVTVTPAEAGLIILTGTLL